MAIQGSCHCGAVTLELTRAPSEVTSCNCSICRRLGTGMGINARLLAPDVVGAARVRRLDDASDNWTYLD